MILFIVWDVEGWREGGDPPVLYNQTCIPQETNITIEQLFRRKEISKLLYPAKESGADDSEEKPTRDC